MKKPNQGHYTKSGIKQLRAKIAHALSRPNLNGWEQGFLSDIDKLLGNVLTNAGHRGRRLSVNQEHYLVQIFMEHGIRYEAPEIEPITAQDIIRGGALPRKRTGVQNKFRNTTYPKIRKGKEKEESRNRKVAAVDADGFRGGILDPP